MLRAEYVSPLRSFPSASESVKIKWMEIINVALSETRVPQSPMVSLLAELSWIGGAHPQPIMIIMHSLWEAAVLCGLWQPHIIMIIIIYIYIHVTIDTSYWPYIHQTEINPLFRRNIQRMTVLCKVQLHGPLGLGAMRLHSSCFGELGYDDCFSCCYGIMA